MCHHNSTVLLYCSLWNTVCLLGLQFCFCVNCGIFVAQFRAPFYSHCMVLRLDYGNAGIPSNLTKRMQSVLNSAARLVFSASRYDRITPLLTQLHWLKVLERIEFKLAVLVYKCLHQTAPPYLAEQLHQSSADEARQRLHCASIPSLVVRRTRLSTIGDRCCPTVEHSAAERHVGVVNIFRKRLKTHLLSHSFHESPVMPAQWFWILFLLYFTCTHAWVNCVVCSIAT